MGRCVGADWRDVFRDPDPSAGEPVDGHDG